jgi:transcriptional regulator with XRE-family HTH domain
MSYFAQELEALMTEKKILSGAEISRISGVDPATISRVRSGTQDISHDDLDKLAAAIDKNAKTHARLLRARLMDHLRPPGGDLIEIELRGPRPASLRETPPDYMAKLPPKIDKMFRTLIANADDTDLRNILSSLANVYEKGSLT